MDRNDFIPKKVYALLANEYFLSQMNTNCSLATDGYFEVFVAV